MSNDISVDSLINTIHYLNTKLQMTGQNSIPYKLRSALSSSVINNHSHVNSLIFSHDLSLIQNTLE